LGRIGRQQSKALPPVTAIIIHKSAIIRDVGNACAGWQGAIAEVHLRNHLWHPPPPAKGGHDDSNRAHSSNYDLIQINAVKRFLFAIK
jgi:hypothetical protein